MNPNPQFVDFLEPDSLVHTHSPSEATSRKISPSNPRKIEILGVPFSDVTQEITLRLLRRFAESDSSHHVVTANTEFVVLAQRDPSFKDILHKAPLSIPDGVGVVLASRIFGCGLRERITGVDILIAFAPVARDCGLSMFLLGAAPGVAEKAAAVLRRENPGLNIVGTFAGSPKPEEEGAIIERIRHARPDALFVAYGTPAQEFWIARNLDELHVPLVIGVGGAFDFIAGVVPRAPVWVQWLGLEWLFRLCRQPWRWKRMLALPKFVAMVIRCRLGFKM